MTAVRFDDRLKAIVEKTGSANAQPRMGSLGKPCSSFRLSQSLSRTDGYGTKLIGLIEGTNISLEFPATARIQIKAVLG